MFSLIKDLIKTIISKTPLQDPTNSKLDKGDHAKMSDIAIDIGSFRLTLKDVATNEDAIARIEEFLKGQRPSTPADHNLKSGW